MSRKIVVQLDYEVVVGASRASLVHASQEVVLYDSVELPGACSVLT